MKVAILGYGKQGQSAYEYWNKPGNDITICDAKIVDVPAGVQTNFESDYLNDLHEYDLVVRSPAIHPRDIRESNTDHPEVMDRVTTVTNEFFAVCPSKNVIGITGTKGKGTTSSLIAKILQAAGNRVHLGGNIGTPPLDMLKNDIKKEDWVVLELANFQLIDLKASPHIAVCLMVAPEHLDWHPDMYEYVRAKQQMFVGQLSHDIVVFNRRNLYSEEIADVSPGIRIPYDVPPEGDDPQETSGAYVKGSHIFMHGKKVCSIHDVALLGRHNLENVCAAIGATWDIVTSTNEKPHDIYESVIKTFAGLPHRLEIVKQINSVWYINDSFAANPEATIAAIDAVEHQLVLIIGGFERNIPLEPLVQKLVSAKNIAAVLAVGESAERINANLQAQKFTKCHVSKARTMAEIVAEAQSLAPKNGAVVLSPGFPSFDMFKNFEDRGLQFKDAVQKL